MVSSCFALTAGLLLIASHIPSCHSFHHTCRPPPSSVTALSSTAAADINIITNSAVVGDADRSFRRGMHYEKIGLFRAAAESFHEAATLYQCFLDQIDRDADANVDADDDSGDTASSSAKATTTTTTASTANGANAFGHVTGLNPEGPNSCLPVLAYACIRLAHLSHDALGDSKAAARLYKEAGNIDPMPSSVSYDGIGTSIEASGGSLLDAVEAYREAYRLNPTSAQALFHLAVALERVGQVEESEPLMERLRRSEAKISCLVDSWGYVRWHTRKELMDANLHRGTRTMLQIGLNAAMSMIRRENGLVCEFGVYNGRSTRMMQEILPLGTEIHGFDTFTGIPQAWGDEPAGSYSTGGAIPNIEGKVYFHKGLFKDTIPVFLDSLKTDDDDYYQPLAFANVDCDLYGSTLDVLERMHSRIVPGTVLVFDEYLCHPTWRQDEFRAWRECCKRFGWQYRYLGFSLSTKQAVVQVTA
mmetsp:Transcript_31267/g.63541  ORF Transcript_31267/g.63541 Transcript_31267/m.63541 type:complete len:474 (-) Transcript_31267:1569-2990(-)